MGGGSEGTWILPVLSTSTPAPHKNAPSEVPETRSHAPGPDCLWDMRRDSATGAWALEQTQGPPVGYTVFHEGFIS